MNINYKASYNVLYIQNNAKDVWSTTRFQCGSLRVSFGYTISRTLARVNILWKGMQFEMKMVCHPWINISSLFGQCIVCCLTPFIWDNQYWKPVTDIPAFSEKQRHLVDVAELKYAKLCIYCFIVEILTVLADMFLYNLFAAFVFCFASLNMMCCTHSFVQSFMYINIQSWCNPLLIQIESVYMYINITISTRILCGLALSWCM